MHASVLVQTSWDTEHILVPGDIIGRLRTASLRIDDPRVSEAHAMLSLRGGRLKILALRGALQVERTLCKETEVSRGQRIYMAPEVYIDVLDVVTPPFSLALCAGEHPPFPLSGAVVSVEDTPSLEFSNRFLPDASLHLWSAGDRWVGRRPGEPVVEITSSTTWELSTGTVSFKKLPLQQFASGVTLTPGTFYQPLRITAQYDAVTLTARHGQPVIITGNSARILSELAEIGQPVSWQSLAESIWRHDRDPLSLRRKWDLTLFRLRKKLRSNQLREDLVISDGEGNVLFKLNPADTLQIQT